MLELLLKETHLPYEYDYYYDVVWYPSKEDCVLHFEYDGETILYKGKPITIIGAYNLIAEYEKNRPWDICLVKGLKVIKEMTVVTDDIASYVSKRFGRYIDTGDCFELVNGDVVLVSKSAKFRQL